MSFKAILKLGGEERELTACNYSFGQSVNEKGKPTSDVYGGTVFFQFEAVGDSDKAITEWMLNPNKKQGGSIVFKKIDEDATMKEVKFEDAYCVQYTESFVAAGSTSMTISATISAKKIDVGGASHDNRWA